MRSALAWLLLLAVVAWCGLVAQHALATWPHLSLDSGTDAGTHQLLRNAETMHVIRHAAAAAVPGIALLWLALRLHAARPRSQ